MALGLIGKKIGMTQVFDENGRVVPVSVIQAGPCVVVQKKTSGSSERVKRIKKKDGSVVQVKVMKSEGYDALKLGFQDKGKKVATVERGQYPEGVPPKKVLREFKVPSTELGSVDVGQTVTVDMFKDASHVDITGRSKGRGFQGAMKRHGFGGGPMTHGSKLKRSTGAIGHCAWPAKVFKGKKMPGQMGDKKVTMQNLRVVEVDVENNILLVKGSVPGTRDGIIYIKKSVKKEG